MTRLFLLLSIVALSCGACAGPSAATKSGVVEWKSGPCLTLWLLSNGDFASEEKPVAQSKPSPTVLLKGTWTAGKGVLTLHATDEADIHLPPTRWFRTHKVDFQTRLELDRAKKVIICHQLHLTPATEPDPRKISYRFERVPVEPVPDWQKLEATLKSR